MFSIFTSMHRQPSNDSYYFLRYLFLLYICTAFLMIISAFSDDLNDNEVFPHLSMNSIHTDKFSSPYTTHMEENDAEEKELLMNLLKSYDDVIKINQSIDYDRFFESSSSISSVRFIPPYLNFSQQSIAIPRMQTVIIINQDPEPLELYSLSEATNQFYSTLPKGNLVLSHGENISINIYYLPRTIGNIKTIFTINTNRGNIDYNVIGRSKTNPFRLRPLINIEIPLNSTYEYTIQFHNPYNYSLDINEIYTSDENLRIDLLLNKNIKNKITKVFEHHEQWHLKAYEMKSIIKINYFAYKLHRLHGFICIKTNFTELIILPIEINVLNYPGLYSNVDVLEFSTDKFVRSIAAPISIPLYVFNNNLDPVMLTDVRVEEKHRKYITIQYKTLPIPPGIHRLNQIAELTIHPTLIPTSIKQIHGYVQVYILSTNEKLAIEIPFDETVIHGSLDYDKDNTYIYISSSNNEFNNEECRPISFVNLYNMPIAIYNITTVDQELLSSYINITYPSSLVYLYPNQWKELVCVTVKEPSLSNVLSTNIQATIDIHSNLSTFHFVVFLYNGFLTVDVLSDVTSGGIRINETNPFELYLASIPINVSRTVTFTLSNPNPIDIAIENFHFTLPNTDIQLDYMQLIDGNGTKVKSTNLYKNENISQFILPDQHLAVFSLTLNGADQPKFHNETITFKTRYQILRINIQYEIVDGSIELTNKTSLHIDAFPNRIETLDIFTHNKFNVPVNVFRMDFITYGTCFAFTWNDSPMGNVKLQPNKIQELGKLRFNMAPLCEEPPSEATCYCGLHHHPSFKQRWDECVSALNTYELDHSLIIKFRNLWKEWTSLVRKQRIQTNIWIYTDRANISTPLTIDFVWPSVLDHMFSSYSRAPLILDFQVIFINITKTQNIIITNPSLNLVTYSVELHKADSDNFKSIINDQIFTISTASKRVDLISGTYHFQLRPTEQITFTVSYRPTQMIKHEMYFIIRNNLTIIESILVRGEGGIGSLRVGHRKATASMSPIIISIDEKQYKLCLNIQSNPLLRKLITLTNTGNMKTIIYDISFDQMKCSGHGFSAPYCSNIEIESNEKYNLQILFQPDYTLVEVNRTLTLNTNIGLISFPIIVRIPQRVLSTCYNIVPRPRWEFRTYCLCLCSLIFLTILIFFTAGYDARRIFDDYLNRYKWRVQIQATDSKMFDLSDLSLAVQDEEKIRERIESLSSTDAKKETTSKNELKSKRSTTPVSENREPSSKVRTPIGSTSSTKSGSNKARRATTTESGSTKSIKTHHEPLGKTQSLQRQKSDQHTTPPVPSKTVSSSTVVTDDETEPFVVPRQRRISSKAKESSTNITPKSNADNNNTVIKRKSSIYSEQINPLKSDDSIDDQQWSMVSSNKGQRKGTTSSRRETHDESHITNKTSKVSSTNSDKQTIPSLMSNIINPIPTKSTHSRRRGARKQSPAPVSNLVKRKSLQDDTPLYSPNREIAFRQLTEQLWAAGLPSSTNACSMSIRSRCSSAPPSERDGGDDDIDWDEPDAPDDDFGRYALQNANSMNDSNDTDERIQTQQKTTPINIPSLMSLSITPPTMTTNTTQQKSTTPTSVIKENIEPLPFPSHHSPGPIQRPNKLSCQPVTQASMFFSDTIESPDTPDVLVQINHLLDHQNSITTVPSTTNISNSTTSPLINDIPTPNVPWTPFSPTEWPSKYDSTWPMANMPSPNIPLTTQIQNPFAPQQQSSKEDSAVWPTALGTATPRSTPLSTRTQPGSEWTEMFSSASASSIEPTKPINNTWTKFLPVSESSSIDNQTTNKPENEVNNQFWDSITQPNSSASWWSKPSTDENNDDKDHSRWDFAR
ncbi:unnamed protein product [Adineta steineri]|uniref:Transmembrane protein n=1 Tax=Adineta steineri TaxID=433720 RepID=A0A813YIZ4_9BILA|nr:unnamed protein product [Adineta steineri]